MRRWQDRVRRLWTDRRGASEYVALAIATPLAIMGFIGGSAVLESMSAQAALHTVAGIADRTLVADGCLTQNAVNAIAATARAAHLNPGRLALTTTSGASGLYGTRGLGVSVRYLLPLTLPGTPWVIAQKTVTAQVANDQSQYVPYGGARQSACASASLVASTFQGSPTSGGGSVVQLPPTPTAISETVAPNPVTVGSALTVTGVVTADGTPVAQAAVAVALGSQASVTVTTNAQGQYRATLTPTQAGTVPVSVSAGPATHHQTVQILPLAPARIVLHVPRHIPVGQAFGVAGTVLAANGQPVADGTAVRVASRPAVELPATTVTTTAGQFTVAVPQGFTQLGPVTVTATAGSVRQSAIVTVEPGPPQSVTLHLRPASGIAGSTWTVSGTVLGPDGTPVAAGTPVTLAASTDTQDALPTLTTNAAGQFTGPVTLTQAGSQTFTAQAGTAQSPPVTVTVEPGPPRQVTNFAATPNPVNQGATTVIHGTLRDAYGNPEPAGVPVTLTATAWHTPVTVTTGQGGGFATAVTFTQAGNQVVQAAVGTTPLDNGAITVAVNAQGAYTLTATQAATTMTAGTTQTVTWILVDSQGHPVPGQRLTFAATPRQGTTLSASQAITNRHGQVTLTITATRAGLVTVTATAATSPNTTASATWVVEPAPPATVDVPVISPTRVVSVRDGGRVYPTISGLAVDRYGNPIAQAPVTVTGGWDPGVTFTGRTNAEGYFSIPLTPVVVGGPYDPTVTVAAANGTDTHTYTNTQLTVTATASLLPPGTPTHFHVTLTGQVGSYTTGYPWFSPANVRLTATVAPSVSGTVWAIGIYDESQGQWVGQCDSGTACTVAALSPFTRAGQSDTYVAVVGVMKFNRGTSRGLPWSKSLIVAESAPLTLTLPQPQATYTGLYPNIWNNSGWFYTGSPVTFDETTAIVFQNAGEYTNGSGPMIRIVQVSQAGQGLPQAPEPVPGYAFQLVNTSDPVVVTYTYNIPNAPTPPAGVAGWTETIAPPKPLAPWRFSCSGDMRFGLFCTANAYSEQLSQLTLTVPISGTTWTNTLEGGSASSLDGYNFDTYTGSWFESWDGWVYTNQPTTVSASARLWGPWAGGAAVQLGCRLTFYHAHLTSGRCTQTSISP